MDDASLKGAGLKRLISIEPIHRLANPIEITKSVSNRGTSWCLQYHLGRIGQREEASRGG